jgi:hypothetical protein
LYSVMAEAGLGEKRIGIKSDGREKIIELLG